MVKPGEYDVYIVISERPPVDQKRDAPLPPAGILKQTMKVPNFNGTNELSVSTPIFASNVEPLTTPIDPAEQLSQPYAFGGTLKITPADQTVFKTANDLQLLFWIYGAQGKDGVPDINIDYSFHVKGADGTEKFFNKTQPQSLNAQTLPPGFNMQSGHQVLGYLGVPLKSFPAGDYRVEFTITDKLSGKTLTQNATFTVQS